VQYFGLDRIERMMMTLRLATAIRGAGHNTVADPFLVSRALGEGQRSVKLADVYALANAMKVNTIVWGYVGHDLHYKMLVTVGVQRRVAGKPLDASTPIDYRKGASAFSDEMMPSDVFTGLIPRLLPDDLGPAKTAAPKTYPRLDPADLPKSPDALVAGKFVSPVASAYALELLAELYPTSPQIGAERMSERALFALDNVAADSPDFPFLKAFAMYMLNRRPAALKILAGTSDPEVETLRALLNGDLPEVQSAQKTVQRRLPSVLLELAELRLAVQYRALTARGLKKEVRSLAESLPGWKLLLDEYSAELDDWTVLSNYALKKAMDRSFPVDGYTADTLLEGKLILADPSDLDASFDLSIDEHLNRLLSSKAAEWCCAPLTYNPTRWDLLEIYESYAESNLLQKVNFQAFVQGNTRRAIDLLDRFNTVYGEHPDFVVERIYAQDTLIQKLQGQERANLNHLINEELYKAWYWLDGQSTDGYSLFAAFHGVQDEKLNWLISRSLNNYDFDFPPRGYWLRATPEGVDSEGVQGLRQRFGYITSNFTMVTPLRDDMLNLVKGRFDGSPEKATILADRDARAGKLDKAIGELLKVVNAKGNNWSIYYRAAQLLMESGKFKEAANVMHRFPGFSDELATGPEKVGYSNDAMAAGSLLFWRGLAAESKPFFKLGADYDTGSGASIESASRIALLEGRYQDAAVYSMERARRYGAVWGYRDYLEFLHVVGLQQQAWQAFDAIVGQFNDLPLWQSALVGHHKAGTSRGKVAAAGSHSQRRRFPA